MQRRELITGLPAAGLSAEMPPLAHAQSFPSKPVHPVLPSAPAGIADVLGRLLAESLAQAWGRSVVVENTPGASGHIGAQDVARSAPDGHTLVVNTIGIHAAYASDTKPSYKPAETLRPVTIPADAANVVLVLANWTSSPR